MIKRLWLLFSILWTIVGINYLTKAYARGWDLGGGIFVMALPWALGIGLYWIIVGRLPSLPWRIELERRRPARPD